MPRETENDTDWLASVLNSIETSVKTQDGLEIVEAFCREQVPFFVQIARQEFHKIAEKPNWKIEQIYSHSDKRSFARGGLRRGTAFISIPTRMIYRRHEFFDEYAQLANDPFIGNIRWGYSSWQNYALCLLAHEIAHAVQYSIFPRRVKAHGREFREVYFKFRMHTDAIIAKNAERKQDVYDMRHM